MYITLTGIQNGEPVYLARSVGDPSACRGLEVALCELTYYHQWSNISAALGNNRHRVQKIVNSGTRLCSYFPKTKNIVITETSNSRRGILKMVSEFFQLGIIGPGSLTSTILLEIVLGDRPDNFVEVLPGFKLKWGQAHANKELGVHVIVREISRAVYARRCSTSS